jgi:hypothetical protein
VVGAESGEISGFTRTMQVDGEVRRDLVLYDRVPGGAGYMRKATVQLEAILAASRALVDGCQCEKSCYKCLRFYENQFEHKLLDKSLIQPYLDHLLILNSESERSRLAAYGTGSQRYCGSNPAAWLQRKYRMLGGGLLVICSGVDDSDVNQATPWTEFLVTYATEHPGVQIELGLTQLPSLADLNEQNFLAVKALLDLMAAGIQLLHVPNAADDGWHMAFGSGEDLLAMAILNEFPSLSVKLDTQSMVYNSDFEVCQAAFDEIRATLRKGRPITAASLSAPKQATYHVVDIEDGERGVTYEKLFGQYLADARRMRIVDPYVRLEYQVRNVENLLTILTTLQGCEVELLTMFEKNERFGLSEESTSRERLDALRERLVRKGIRFTYAFDPQIHDRFIETNQWQIILGRGLDVYYPPEPGRTHLSQSRRAKKCRIIFLPKTGGNRTEGASEQQAL